MTLAEDITRIETELTALRQAKANFVADNATSFEIDGMSVERNMVKWYSEEETRLLAILNYRRLQQATGNNPVFEGSITWNS